MIGIFNLIKMKEVIEYLERWRSNIESIAKLRREHKFLLDIIEKENLLTNERVKQFRTTNNNVSVIIFDEKFLV